MSPTEATLREVAFYRSLSERDREEVAKAVELTSYPKKATILEEGADSTHWFSIVSGRVKVFKMTASGKDVILGLFGPGDPVGIVAVLRERPYPASAVALEPTECLRIPRDALFRLLETRPTVVRGLMLGMATRILELTDHVAELSGLRVEHRIARLLLRLGNESGRPERGGLFVPLALSRQELADMTGTTIETCIRVMSRWGKQEIVRTEPDGFVLLDEAALAELALM